MSPSKTDRRGPPVELIELSKSYQEGERLSEAKLCETHSVSRTPVRLALRLLEREGVDQMMQLAGVLALLLRLQLERGASRPMSRDRPVQKQHARLL